MAAARVPRVVLGHRHVPHRRDHPRIGSIGAEFRVEPRIHDETCGGVVSGAFVIPTGPRGASPVDVSFDGGDWSPYDELTEGLSFGKPVRVHDGGHKLVDLQEGVTGVARHMQFCIPVLSGSYGALAAYATAVAISKGVSTGQW